MWLIFTRPSQVCFLRNLCSYSSRILVVLIDCGLGSQQLLQFYRNGKLIRLMKSDTVGHIWRHDETLAAVLHCSAVVCCAALRSRSANNSTQRDDASYEIQIRRPDDRNGTLPSRQFEHCNWSVMAHWLNSI